MEHHFDVDIAKKLGVNAAIIYNNIKFWCLKNKANEKNFYDGNYWTYNSIKAWKELFPYFGEKQIRNALDCLVENNMIICGEYNQNRYDRTKWYGILELAERANGDNQKGEPIPYNKPDIKPYKDNVSSTRNELSQSEIDATTIAKYLFSTITSFNPTFKNDWSKWVKDIELAIRLDKRTKDELINLINWIYNSKKGEFWISNILSGKKLREKYDSINIQMIADKTSSQSSGNSPKTAKVFVPNNLLGKVFYNRYNQKCEFKVDGIWNYEQDRLVWDTETVNYYVNSFSEKNILGDLNASFKQI